MKRITAYSLIVFLLSVTIVGSNWHNHPINGEETPDCPAYIISIVVNSDVPVNLLDALNVNLLNSISFKVDEHKSVAVCITSTISNKSPPKAHLFV